MKKLGIVLLVLLIGAFLYYQNSQKPQDEYIFTKAKKGDLIDSVDASGEVFAADLVTIGAQASGQVKNLYVKIGDKVKAGDKIADIDSIKQKNILKQQLAQLEILKAQLNSAKIAAKIAKTQYDREAKLAKMEATSIASLEKFKNDFILKQAGLKEVEAKIEQTQIEIETAKTNLSYTNIVAPMDGVIVAVLVKVGQTINASQTTPAIAYIADLSKMQIKMQISESDITKIKVGDKVVYNVLAEPKRKFGGVLSLIDPGLSTLSDGEYKISSGSSLAVYYYATLDVNNDDNFLRIGMTTQNKIIINEIKDALIVPTIAIKTAEDGSNYVLVKKEQDIVQIPVKIGISSSINTQILSGLQEGDEVISSSLSRERLDEILSGKKVKMRI